MKVKKQRRSYLKNELLLKSYDVKNISDINSSSIITTNETKSKGGPSIVRKIRVVLPTLEKNVRRSLAQPIFS